VETIKETDLDFFWERSPSGLHRLILSGNYSVQHTTMGVEITDSLTLPLSTRAGDDDVRCEE
jgi:hypothetical protein